MAVFLREEGCSKADFAAVLTRAYAEGAPRAESESRAVSRAAYGVLSGDAWAW